MPDTYVQMPDNTYIQFPAGTSDDIINNVSRLYAKGAYGKSSPHPAGGGVAPPPAAPQQFDPAQVAKETDRWFGAYRRDTPDQVNVPAQAVYDLVHDRNPLTWQDRIPKMSPITQHVIHRKVDELKLQAAKDEYFNTVNPQANAPMKLATALAANPQNPKLLALLNRYKDPYVRQAVQQKAAEFANKPVYEPPSGIQLQGGFGQAPVYRDPHTGERVGIPKPSEIAGTLIRGPEGQKKATEHPTGPQELGNLALSTLDPETQAFGALMTLIPEIAIPAKIAGAGMVGAQGVAKIQRGDTGAGLVDLTAAALLGKSAHGDIAEGIQSRALAKTRATRPTPTPTAEPVSAPAEPSPGSISERAFVDAQLKRIADRKAAHQEAATRTQYEAEGKPYPPLTPEGRAVSPDVKSQAQAALEAREPTRTGAELSRSQQAQLVAERKAQAARAAQEQAAQTAAEKARMVEVARRKAAVADQPVALSPEAEARAARSAKARIVEERKARAARIAAVDAEYESQPKVLPSPPGFIADAEGNVLPSEHAPESQPFPKPFSIVPDPLIEHPSMRGEATPTTPTTESSAESTHTLSIGDQQIPVRDVVNHGDGTVSFTDDLGKAGTVAEEKVTPNDPTKQEAPGFVQSLITEGQAAADRISKARSKGKGKLQSGADPTGGKWDEVYFQDLVKVGVGKMAKAGSTAFDSFSRAMVDEYGPSIRPLLKRIYTSARAASAPNVATGATDPVVQKVVEGINSAQKVQKEKLAGYSEEKAQRAAAYAESLKAGGYTREAEKIARGNLSGPLPQPDFERPQVSDSEREALHMKINTFYKWQAGGSHSYNKAAANVALDKVIDHGMVPGNYELNLLREVFGQDMVKALAKHRGPMDFWDYMLGWQRFSILSGAATLGKLSAAATLRTVITPAEELIGFASQKVPALGRIAESAPRGRGFNAEAEAEAVRAFFGKAMNDTQDPGVLADIKSKLKTGNSSLDRRFGTEGETHPFLDFFTRLHGALKVPAQRAEFYRSLTKRSEFAARTGEDIRDPEVQVRIGAEAYADSERAIFMQDNLLVDKWQEFLNGLDASGRGGKGIKVASRVLLPIVRVPTNYVGEVGESALGVPLALLKVVRSKENLSQVESEAVLRMVKKGSIGMGMFALGYMHPEWMQGEGEYVPGEVPHRGKKFGDIKFLGYTVPAWALHNPAIELFQMGSTAHRVSSKLRPQDRDLGEQIRQTLTGTALELPFMEEARTVGMATDSKKGAQKAEGAVGRSLLEPIIMQQIAAARDYNKRRKPRDFTEEMKMGVPGLREQVPLSQYQTPRFQP